MKMVKFQKDAPVGATVKYLGRSKGYTGKVGTVVRHSSTGGGYYCTYEQDNLVVDFDGVEKTFAVSQFALVDADSTDTNLPLTRQDEAAIGSRVTYIGSSPRYRGKTGTVTEHTYKRQYVWRKGYVKYPQLKVDFEGETEGETEEFAVSQFVLASAVQASESSIINDRKDEDDYKFFVTNSYGKGFIGDTIDEAATKCSDAGYTPVKAYRVTLLGTVERQVRTVYSIKS